MRVRFGDEWTDAYRRHELTSDERLETDGVVIERVSLGAVARSDVDGGKTLLKVAFDDTASADHYERFELTADGLVRTDGAIAESFGPDGRLIEVIAFAELAQRGVAPHFLSTEE
ncbi:hypothetical protein [Micromonospora chersina]|uniref:hypothetical protein n=1 Tax=Micromonospora chersina TaxID=47854 RepID=UPI001112D709|nr:hypothetical protein [Micromonospora chersina]